MVTTTETKENVGTAFLIVCVSGLATALGAAVVFLPSLVRYANQRVLAISMGLSAGVMLYVSFVEILAKSHQRFLQAQHGQNGSAFYAAACFFAGIFFMTALNTTVHALSGGHHHHHHHHGSHETPESTSKTLTLPGGHDHDDDDDDSDSDESSAFSFEVGCPCTSEDPKADLEKVHAMALKIQEGDGTRVSPNTASPPLPNSPSSQQQLPGAMIQQQDLVHDDMTVDTNADDDQDHPLSQKNKKRLFMTSINTALAIALHNFPEGLATFVAAVEDPAVGVVLAVAIAIHNIPEGLCVAMPIYFATGNRCKAFGWAVLSGLSEPFAALFGYAALAHAMSDTLYAVLFGLVSGMMVIIAIKELLPTARRYDPQDEVVTSSFVVGMGVMALSLVLFAA